MCACARAQSRLSHVYRLEEKGVSYFQKNVLQVFRKRSITRISRKRNRDILLGTWNVRSLYRAGSLMQEVGGGRGDWMELAQDRDRWRALVGTVRDFRVP